MRRQPLLFLFTVVALIITACNAIGASTCGQMSAQESHTSIPADAESPPCVVTRPPEPTFVPFAPWPAQPPDADRFWFGANGLWAALPRDGRWSKLG
jgi:hypothetical protein